MKLVTYKKQNEKLSIGVIYDNKVIDLPITYKNANITELGYNFKRIPTDMTAFLALGDAAMNFVKDLLDKLDKHSDQVLNIAVPLNEVTLMAPVLKPGKILCVGLNYVKHAQEGGRPIPIEPVVFGKYANAITGPNGAICLPSVSQEVDYEAELAVVIGKRACKVDKKSAMACVAGYTNFNDISARDLQRKDGQWMKGKFLDTFAPIGPWLVTKDEVQDPQNLDIQLQLNGQIMQSSNTKDMIFDVAHLVSFFSNLLTLEPGDIIATGTPSGVGFARKPPVFLQPGDTVEVSIEKLGVLQNSVVKD